MAKIQNRRVTQGVVDELKLRREVEKVPEEITTKIVPVFEVSEKGVIKVLKDHTANDSDKSFTVPKGQYWEILTFFVACSTDATVGNRVWRWTVTDEDGDIIYDTRGDGTQAASTGYKLQYSPLITTTDVATSVNQVMHCLKYIQSGWTIRFYDSATVSAAGDDCLVSIHYKEFTQKYDG